jgi:uncharacterized membrane protein YeaQ/YmgE (transglycosylase-associated protein family)
MQDLKDGLDFLMFILLGLISGAGAELLARRKIWIFTPQRVGAVIIGLVGGLVGSLLFNDVFGWLNDPAIFDVSIFPVLLGAIIFLVPWWLVRSGRTSLSKNRKWRSAYWRK